MVAELARRCLVDDDAERADASEMVALAQAALRAERGALAAAAASGAAAARLFPISVRDLGGARSVSVDASASMSVARLKLAIEGKLGVVVWKQELLFAGLELEDARTLDDYNLMAGTVVHLRVRVHEPEPEPQ
eukprot:COSAG01_NODE_9318_length_2484_cov_33.445219_3_plen_134_part_00